MSKTGKKAQQQLALSKEAVRKQIIVRVAPSSRRESESDHRMRLS